MSACNYNVDENGIAEMTIDNPPMNALSNSVLNDIESTILKALNDDSVRVIVFTGAGRAFIAGADINEIKNIDSKEKGTEFPKNGQDIFNLIENSDKPIIAAINGFALGGGTELALACHIRFADETAQLGLPEITLGIIPGFGGTQRTSRLVGKARAFEMILTGNFISAKEAYDIGLVNKVTPKGQVVEESKKLALDIAKKGRPAVKAAMKAINEGMNNSFARGLEIEREEFGKLCDTENMKEGVAAFLEKRKPEPKDN